MKNIKIIFEYDGSKYFGFQRQSSLHTVQGELEKALSRFLKQDIELVAAGRTDKGVHGLNQVATFTADTVIPIEKLAYIMNKGLDEAIRIKSSEEVPMDFHARYSAKSRKYVYLMKNVEKYNTFERNYISFIDGELDVNRFLNILEPLMGKNDFNGFRKSDCNARTSIREVKELYIEKEGDTYKLFIKADGFLKSMVRIIVGSALAIYFGIKEEDYIVNKLKKPNIDDAKIMAPPQGLYLYEVEY